MIRRSIVLACAPARAFALFTGAASEWWPETRRHTDDPQSEIRFLPTGRIWERSAGGREVELGVVRSWDPPHRLSFDFYVGTDRDHPTEVVVTFAPEDDKTRVTVEHRPTASSAELWNQRSPRFAESWEVMLEAFGRVQSEL